MRNAEAMWILSYSFVETLVHPVRKYEVVLPKT